MLWFLLSSHCHFHFRLVIILHCPTLKATSLLSMCVCAFYSTNHIRTYFQTIYFCFLISISCAAISIFFLCTSFIFCLVSQALSDKWGCKWCLSVPICHLVSVFSLLTKNTIPQWPPHGHHRTNRQFCSVLDDRRSFFLSLHKKANQLHICANPSVLFHAKNAKLFASVSTSSICPKSLQTLTFNMSAIFSDLKSPKLTSNRFRYNKLIFC